jgi:ketosteroid isomerase-like protein
MSNVRRVACDPTQRNRSPSRRRVLAAHGFSNDFLSVGAVLGEDFVLDWPQTNERVRGKERFVALNSEYPANGPWRFAVRRVVGSETEAVSDVIVTDGVQRARAISFFTVAAGKITRVVEYWPEPYEAPASRRHLVEPIS